MGLTSSWGMRMIYSSQVAEYSGCILNTQIEVASSFAVRLFVYVYTRHLELVCMLMVTHFPTSIGINHGV